MKYIKQLDSLRAIAVILVILSHWVSTDSWVNWLPNGEIGVDIFFVLSGFLISKILFENRNKAETTGIVKTTVLKNFYIRRCLRIFPIYYITIFLLLLFAKSTGTNIKGAFIYFFTYTSNIYFFKIKVWDGMLSHLWSLAVEEQFYLMWPLIILFINKKYFSHAICSLIAVGMLSQYFVQNIKMSNVLTFTCFDALGFGALLAWQLVYHAKKLKKFYSVVCFFSIAAFCLLILRLTPTHWNFIPLRIIISVLALWIITSVVLKQQSGKANSKSLLNNKVLIFLGKISYGIYLYHNIVPRMLNQNIINKYLNPLLPDLLFKEYWAQLYFIENSILLVIVSWLSYMFIEKQFLNLKKYFGYQNQNSLENITAQLIS